MTQTRSQTKKMNDQTELNDYTVMHGVICNACKGVLEPHTIGNHLDKDFMKDFHVCGENEVCAGYPYKGDGEEVYKLTNEDTDEVKYYVEYPGRRHINYWEYEIEHIKVAKDSLKYKQAVLNTKELEESDRKDNEERSIVFAGYLERNPIAEWDHYFMQKHYDLLEDCEYPDVGAWCVDNDEECLGCGCCSNPPPSPC